MKRCDRKAQRQGWKVTIRPPQVEDVSKRRRAFAYWHKLRQRQTEYLVNHRRDFEFMESVDQNVKDCNRWKTNRNVIGNGFVRGRR